jgi:outer membrane PBP1 activator LpoA protein
LQVETEAKQIAQMVFSDGRRRALTVVDEQALMRRIERAFADEFRRAGGEVVAQFAHRTSTADLLALREAATSGRCDAVFLALDGARARLSATYVQGPAQTYATSQILLAPQDRLRDADLNGVRFVAMPWLLERDHPAVMAYAGGAELPAPTDLERLYAFGIDAYRLASALLQRHDPSRQPLDGVTGRIRLQGDGHFVRELTPAQFVDGRPVPIVRIP